MERWSTKNKTLLFVTTVLLLFSILLLGSFYWNQKKELAASQKAYAFSLKSTYEKLIAKRNHTDYTDAMVNINSRNIKESISKHDRKMLFHLTSERWKALKMGNKHLTIMHFHLNDGTALLRMHAPHKFGDNVATFRPMIAAVSKEHKVIHGFEAGLHNLAYRTVVPIFEHHRYIGALEIGSRPDAIFEDMEYYSGLKGALFVKNKALNLYKKENFQIDDYVLQYDAIQNKSLFYHLKKSNYSFPMLYKTTFNDHKYLVYAFDVKDYTGVVVAKAVFINDITELENTFHQKMVEIATYLFVTLFLVVLIIELGFQNLIQKLDTTNTELNESREFLHSIIDTSHDGIALLDLKTRFLFSNQAYLTMTGFTDDELLKTSCAELSAPEDLPRAMMVLEEVKKIGFVENFEKTCIVKENKKIRVSMAIALMPDKKRLLINVRDITEAKKLEKKLVDHMRLIDQNIITTTTDLEGNIVEASHAFCVISGYTKEELIGKNHRIVRHPDMADSIYQELWATITQNQVWRGELKNLTKSGGYYWVEMIIFPVYDEEGHKISYTAIRHDISDKKIIEEIAITDALTGMYNRRHFNTLFPRFVNSIKRNNDFVCFAIMDIDHFKEYNDTYGHLKGDEVLARVAECIRSKVFRSDDYCFRLGGEEFGLTFKCEHPQKSLQYIDTIRSSVEALEIEHQKNSASTYVTISIGLMCVSGATIENETQLYAQADECLYRAKGEGRNRVVLGNIS